MLGGSHVARLFTPMPTSSNNVVCNVHSVITQKTVFLCFNILENQFFAAECYFSECYIVS
jgi:hypothetical protein